MRKIAMALLALLVVGSAYGSNLFPKKGKEYLVERAKLELKYAYINRPEWANSWRIAYSEISFVPVVVPFSSGKNDNFVTIYFGLENDNSDRGVEVVFRVCPDGSEQLVSYGSVSNFAKTVKLFQEGPVVGYDLGDCVSPDI